MTKHGLLFIILCMGFASLSVCSVIKYEFIQEKQQNGKKISKRLIFEFEESLKKESQSEENGNLWVVIGGLQRQGRSRMVMGGFVSKNYYIKRSFEEL